MRLIDADIFAKKLEDKWILHEISNNDLAQIGKWLAQEQTVEAVPVIRCRDCRAWKEKECNLPEHGWCGCLGHLTHKGDYCAWSPNLDEGGE